MRKLLFYTMVMMLIVVSCKAQENYQVMIIGTFYGLDKDKDFSKSYTLELNRDSSFRLIIKVQDANPQCEGKWRIVDDEILLECEEGDNPFAMISSGYMGDSKHKLLIVNKNKLKYDGVVLKRKK